MGHSHISHGYQNIFQVFQERNIFFKVQWLDKNSWMFSVVIGILSFLNI